MRFCLIFEWALITHMSIFFANFNLTVIITFSTKQFDFRFLGDTDWNIKMALMTFRSCMERGMLGNEAFE